MKAHLVLKEGIEVKKKSIAGQQMHTVLAVGKPAGPEDSESK